MNIQKILINFYSKHKHNLLVQFMRDLYSREFKFPYDILAERRLEKIVKKTKNTKRNIRVCFVCTDPNVWGKLEAVYDEMLKNEKFDVYILCIPDPYAEDKAETYNFFKEKGYNNCIDAMDDAGKYYNLRSLNIDYIFYGQPYNNYLPKQYRSYITSKYARVCIMTYGMTVSWNFLKLHPRNFHRDVYKCYAVVKEEIEFNKSQFPRLYQKKLQQTVYLGFPAFSQFMRHKGEKSRAFSFSKNQFRAIWTPRWVTDESLGGSNFFRYKDVLFKYAEEHRDIDMLFRPHPMALENFLKTGEMTEAEVKEFRRKCSAAENVGLDSEKEYAQSFWEADVLISDLSTVVVEYFITGNPIIYCVTQNSEQDYLDYFKKLLSCCYMVYNEQELCDRITQLKDGNDPMKEKRHKAIKKIFGDTLTESPKLIAEDFIKDYYG